MRTHNLFSRLGAMLVAFALLLLVAGENSYAAGTRAGTQITSNATATYHDQTGGGPTYNASATALSIYVAYKPVSTITVVTSPQTGVDSSYVVYQLNIVNSGNYGDAYAVEFNSSDTKYDSVGYYSNAGLTAALGGPAGHPRNILRDTIPTDGNVNVYAKVYIKFDATFNSYDAQTFAGTFRSRSTRDVAADSGILISGSNYVPIGGAGQNATFNAPGSTTTTIAQSIFNVTATPMRSSVRPGDTLSFNVAYNNSGSAANTGVKIFVTYPANMSYSPLSSANWSNQGSYAVFTVGSVAATSGVLSIANPLILSATNSASLVEGTQTSLGSFGIIYTQNVTNGLTQTRIKSSTFSTATYAFKAFAPTIAVVDTTLTGNPGDTVTVAYTITNNSNGADAYRIRYSTASQLPTSWGFVYYYDKNGNNTFDAGTDSLMAAGLIDYRTTKEIVPGSSITVFLRVAVPSGLTITPVHVVNLASSYRDSVTTGDFNLWAQVTPQLPNIVVTRTRVINSSDSVGLGATVSVIPGGTVTYYIYVSNTGTGTASTVVITDNVSATGGFTNAPTSVTVNDGSDHTFGIPGTAGGASVSTGATGVVITINSLPAGASKIIHYATTVQ